MKLPWVRWASIVGPLPSRWKKERENEEDRQSSQAPDLKGTMVLSEYRSPAAADAKPAQAPDLQDLQTLTTEADYSMPKFQ